MEKLSKLYCERAYQHRTDYEISKRMGKLQKKVSEFQKKVNSEKDPEKKHIYNSMLSGYEGELYSLQWVIGQED